MRDIAQDWIRFGRSGETIDEFIKRQYQTGVITSDATVAEIRRELAATGMDRDHNADTTLAGEAGVLLG